MDKASIGTNAGIVWRIIHERGALIKYEEVKQISGLPDRDLNAAIGWLARENKIEFSTNPDGNELFFTDVNVFF